MINIFVYKSQDDLMENTEAQERKVLNAGTENIKSPQGKRSKIISLSLIFRKGATPMWLNNQG